MITSGGSTCRCEAKRDAPELSAEICEFLTNYRLMAGVWSRLSDIRVRRILQWRGFEKNGCGNFGSLSVGSRGKAPVCGLWPTLKHNAPLLTFFCGIFGI